MGTQRLCTLCGSTLLQRQRAELDADLTHVRWAIDDTVAWDASVVTPSVRGWLLHRFRQQERALVGCLVPEVHHVTAPRAPEVEPWVVVPLRAAEPTLPAAAQPDATDGAKASAPVLPPAEVKRAPPSPGQWVRTAAPEVEASPQTPEQRVVEEASQWHRVWRPFLNESVGWFIGAFLILAGTFYFVADVWNDLGAEGRALLVFGGTSVWTLGFFAWARFLSRREVTKSAARVLKLIAAVIAPLPTVALWPLAAHQPLLFWPLLVGWAAAAAALARDVSKAYDAPSAGPLALSMAATAAMMGLAPLLATGGHPVLWLDLVPLAAMALVARQGPRESREAQLYAMLAPLFLLGLFGTRLAVALLERDAMPPLATHTAFAAVALMLVLELREAPARKSADAFSVLVVALQAALAVAAIWGEAPAVFFTCAVGAFTTYRLAQRGPSEASARWLYGTYALAYFAWQACGQLVPGVLVELLAKIKHALGYAASQPLPPSYNAVYAAAFVVVVGIFALVRARSAVARLRASAPVLLRASVVTGLLVAGMALPVVASDARPTVFSLPFVAALLLVVAWREGRTDAAWSGALLLALSAVGFAFLPGVNPALVVALVAALAAGLSVPAKALLRTPLSIAAGLLAAGAASMAFVGPAGVAQVVALAVAGGAALGVARNTDVSMGLEGALALLALVPVRAVQCLTPEAALFALSGSALALAAVNLRGGRAVAAGRVASALALLAAGLSLCLPREVGAWLDPTLLVGAAALAVTAPRAWQGWAAIALGGLAFMPMPYPHEAAFASPELALGLSLAGAALAAGWAWRHDRNVHAGVLAATAIALSLGGALTAEKAWLLGFSGPHWLVPTVVLLLAGRALWPSLTLPLAVLTLLPAIPLTAASLALVAVAVAAAGLLERHAGARAHLLGGARLAWSSTVTAHLVLFAALALGLDATHPHGLTLAMLAVAALGVPLLGSAATRSAVPMGLLALATSTLAGMGGVPGVQWLAPVLVLAVSRGMAASSRAKAAFGLGGGNARQGWQWALVAPLALTAPLLDATLHISVLPAAAAMLLCAVAPLSARLGLAAALALLSPAVAPVAALAVLATAFLCLHAPRLSAAVFGAEPDENVRTVAALGSVVLAAFGQFAPHAGLFAVAALVASLAGAALLLRQRWLLAVAVVAAAFPIQWVLQMRGMAVGLELALSVAFLAGAVAALLQTSAVAKTVRGWASVAAKGFDADLREPLWWGAFLCAVAVAPMVAKQADPATAGALVAIALVLGVSRSRLESAAAAALLGVGAFLVAPAGWEGAFVGAVGLGLCGAGAAFDGRGAAARAWHWSGFALSVLALGTAVHLHHVATPLTWAFACASAWVVVRGQPRARWAAWVATVAAAHVALFWAGLTLSHGQPQELILPWVGAASLAIAAAALFELDDAQRANFGLWATAFGLAEMLAAVVLLPHPYGRELVVATVALSASMAVLGRRAAKTDSASAAVLAQLALGTLWAVWHGLGLGGRVGTVDAVALLVVAVLAGGLSVFAARHEKAAVATALKVGAFVWPLAALGFVADGSARSGGLVLLATAAHFMWLSQAGLWKRFAAVAAAVAFNVALLTLWFAAGWSSAYYLFIAAGLSVIGLVKLFEADLSAEWAVRLRAFAAATIYAAAAWRPLAFDTSWALWVCVVVCVLGVAAGIALRVRSYVYLGTAFLVTSVISNLVRYGVREPRVGALLLSSLGLLVVGFMVVVTTRRGELLQRYRQVHQLLQAWDG